MNVEQFAEIVGGDGDWVVGGQNDAAAIRLTAARGATRIFWNGFAAISIVLYATATVLLATGVFSGKIAEGCFFGMAICTVSSVVSFLISEWAFEQPKGIFMAVALGLVVVRMFNLLFAFAVGLFFLKFHAIGMAAGMLAAYFSYLILEVAYVHKKGLLIGE